MGLKEEKDACGETRGSWGHSLRDKGALGHGVETEVQSHDSFKS